MNSVTFKKILNIGKLTIGLDNCVVYESISVPRCFNCNSFQHTSKFCKNGSVSCPLCAGEHGVKECRARNNEYKCSNCFMLKNKQNISIDINHAAWEYNKCHAYKQLSKKLKSEFLSSQ